MGFFKGRRNAGLCTQHSPRQGWAGRKGPWLGSGAHRDKGLPRLLPTLGSCQEDRGVSLP